MIMEMRSVRGQRGIIAGTLKRSIVCIQFQFQQITVADPGFLRKPPTPEGDAATYYVAKYLSKNA